MCGEKKKSHATAVGQKGSPPHVRGKGSRFLRMSQLSGITPACAGKSVLGGQPQILIRDHPRMCGEKCTGWTATNFNQGSPPHVRGKVSVAQCCFNSPGITPACAGKRIPGAKSKIEFRDHPRMCGEKKGKIKSIFLYRGSPPQERGKVYPLE